MEVMSHSGAFSYKYNTAERGGCSLVRRVKISVIIFYFKKICSSSFVISPSSSSNSEITFLL